ncbi:MAG: ABC transporter substrate-binding protein, partial [Erysipelotrichaceae bacterium]|nr:ABC transporter substrate-binding protein [Erysipelotrichaceae bacterium]
ETYQQYLNSTENDAVHYKVKLEAVKLVLANIENTFVTPVFNGSASLRDASGQLIEEVVKSKRRNQTVDDAYYQSLFDKVKSLYRLDQGPTTIGGKKDLGPLPTGAKALIGGLVTIWILLGAVYISGEVKRKKNVR